MIKLLISDVDGTLINPDKKLTARSIEAVHRLRDAGIQFTITSSRPPRGLAMLVKALKISAPVAAFNGGLFVQPDLKTVIKQHTLSLDVATEVVNYLVKAEIEVWVYRGSDWFVRHLGTPHVERERRAVQFDPTVIRDLRDVLDGAIKILGVSDDAPLMACCEAELRECVGSRVSASRSQSYYLDVTHPDANKGGAVREAARFFHLESDEIAVIGDMPTDVLMFGVAGTSIAMGNASPDVQRSARFVTTSNAEEGFAHAVDRFILAEARSVQTKLGLPPETRACLFDLDGVLTQTSKLHAAAWKEMFDEYLRKHSHETGQPFVPFDSVRDYNLYVDGKLRLDGARSFLSSRGIELPEESVIELARQKDVLVLQKMENEHVEAYEGSIRYLHAAREAGLRTAVVSSSKHCAQALASAGIADLFDARIDGNIAAEEHLAGKPAPDTYLAAAHAVGVDPAQAVIFEDALSGVEAGRAGHFGYVVGVDRVGQSEELRRHGADVVVTDLASLLEKK